MTTSIKTGACGGATSATGVAIGNSEHRYSADSMQRSRLLASRILQISAMVWLGVAMLGQLLFAIYVAGFYGLAAMHGNPQAWNRVLPHGYVAGDTFFNGVLGLHLAFAVLIILGGVLQLMPRMRRRMPAFHRWNGRVYLLAACVLAIGGLAMVWIRGGMVGDLPQHVGVSVNAVLIVTFAAIAWRYARTRQMDSHRRWALRLFLAVSGVWFFRVGLMFWILVNQGPRGFDPQSFTGPALSALSFAQFLVPLAVLELYFLAQARRIPRVQHAMAAALGLLTLLMSVGIGAATAFMWLPRI